MAVCKKCGKKISNNSKFCTNCGTSTNAVVKSKTYTNSTKVDDIKVFKALSYVGILWIIGLFIKQKDDVKLKFHVGQGIILTIYSVIVNMITNFLQSIVYGIFRTEQYVLGHATGVFNVTIVGNVLAGIISLIGGLSILAFMIIGIKNALNDEENELPIIGRYSFYK